MKVPDIALGTVTDLDGYGDCEMAISKNFLVLAALTLFVTSLMALHPLAPDSSESVSESFVHRPTTQHYN